MHDFYISFTSIKKKLQNMYFFEINIRIYIFLKLFIYNFIWNIFYCTKFKTRKKTYTFLYILYKKSTKKTSNIRISFWNYSTLYETFVLLYNNENQELKISWQI